MRINHPRVGLLAIMQACFLGSTVLAEARPAAGKAEDERVIAQCIRKASGGRTWLEKALWGLRDQEGGWIGAEIANRNGTHDLGPMQVNSWWVPRLAKLTGKPQPSVRHWLTYDACFNVDSARWIFLSELAATRDFWRAVGAYHSPTPWRQERYRNAVVMHMRRRFGSAIFSPR